HGRSGIRRMWSGSVAERVVRHAFCDVLVVRAAPSKWPPERILVGTDLSEASRPAVSRAAALRDALGASMSLVYVHDHTVPIPLPSGAFEGLEHARKRYREELLEIASAHSPAPDATVLTGTSPAHAICDHAGGTGADLIVVGT